MPDFEPRPGRRAPGHGHAASSFGELLRGYRARSGFSQEVLAERARISVSAIGALEQGLRRAPYQETIALLAQALALSQEEREELDLAANRARGRRALHRAEGLESPPNNLPTPLTSFIAREEVAEITSLIEHNRLVTVTGPGGIGKTRTVLEVAGQRLRTQRDSIWFLDLAPLRDANLMFDELESILGIELERPDALHALVALLRRRSFLLIIDNCERVVAKVADLVATLLRGCPGISVLATSRERLNLSNEIVYRLPSLPVPNPRAARIEQGRYPAIDLFVARAKSADWRSTIDGDGVAFVVDICRRLEGIPLAIELAAANVPTLGLDTLRSHLDAALAISGARDLPQRHQTMNATITWSYDLLSAQERALLRRLSVFVGGFDICAVEAVCCGDNIESPNVTGLLARLVDQSLVNVSRVGESTRYTLLDSVRTYASDALSGSGEYPLVARGHAAWLAAFADSRSAELAAIRKGGFPEFENARAAIQWSIASGEEDDAILAARIICGFRRAWAATGRTSELARLCRVALERIDENRHPAVAANLLRALTGATRNEATLVAAQRAIPLLERIGDDRVAANLHGHLAIEFCKRHLFAQADESLDRAASFFIDKQNRHAVGYTTFLGNRAWIRCVQGRLKEARRDNDELRDLIEGDERLAHENGARLVCLAEIEFAGGHDRRALEVLEEVLTDGGAERYPIAFANGLMNQSCYLLSLGDLEGADAAGRKALSYRDDLGSVMEVEILLQHLAAILALRGHPARGARILGFVDEWFRGNNYRRLYTEQRSFDILFKSLEEQLSVAALARLRAEGSQLNIDEAIDELLAVPAPALQTTNGKASSKTV